MKMPIRRIRQREETDQAAIRDQGLPWVKRYRRDPNRVLEEWDVAEASSIMHGLNLNRYQPETRAAIREARSAVRSALLAVYDENWGHAR